MYSLRLLSNRESGIDLYRLVWQAPAEMGALYTLAGQFLEIQIEGQRSYFALASAPGDESLELLVKKQSGLAEELCSLAPGSVVQSSSPLGKGFGDVRLRGANLHLLAMGSGAAPLRAFLRSAMQSPELNRIHFWQAAFDAAHAPYREEHHEWRSAGVQVHLSLDRDGPLPADVDAYAGSLLEHFRARLADSENAYLLWVGSAEFGAAVRKLASDLGLPAERVLTNA